MTEWNVPVVLDAMEKAAAIALDYYERPEARLKSDRTIVTQADIEIERTLGELFEDSSNGSYVIGEESFHSKGEDYLGSAMDNVAWIIDPIDGTAPYSHHIPTWGISIGRMVEGVIIDGAIYLPVTGEIFITEDENILYGKAMFQHLDRTGLQPLVVTPRSPDSGGMIALTQAFARNDRLYTTNPVQALACAVFPLTYMLLGRYLGYVGTLNLWDIAGALAMYRRAGFHCMLLNGTPVDSRVSADLYDLDNPDPDKRWKLKDRFVCGGSKAAVEYLISALTAPGPQ